MTIKEIDTILKSIFSAPLGCYPKGGVVPSFRLTKSTSPSFITLTTEKKEWGRLKLGKGVYLVEHSFNSVTSEHTEVREAITSLLTPFLHEEIERKTSHTL